MSPEEFQKEAVRLRPRLMRQAQMMLDDSTEAEDIVQDAMLKLWFLHDDLQKPIDALASVLVRNLAVSHLRKRRKPVSLSHIDIEDVVSDERQDERIDQLMSLVDSLPPSKQVILKMRDMEGMDYQQISTLTGINEPTIRKTLSRTRHTLRIRLMAALSALVALVVVATFTLRVYQDYQWRRQYEGSYVIIDGQRNDNLRQIRPQIERTLAEARRIEQESMPQAAMEEIESDLLQSIDDPEERQRIQQFLND